MIQKDYTFSTEMQVRDYELDYQGIVNNANYLHYLEHTRHQFCDMAGLSFAEMHRRGIDPVLAHVEIDFKTPLQSDDKFISCLNIHRKGPKFVFEQDIFKSDGTSVVSALVTVACMENGKLTRGDVLAEAFGSFLK